MEPPKDVDKLRYYSKRPLKNEEGERTSTVVIWVIKGEKEANLNYECPFCGHEGRTTIKLEITRARGRGENYRLEFPFEFECENCGEEIEIERMNPNV